jgi:hypothetical protein
MLYEKGPHGEEYREDYSWISYACGTCGGLNLFGDFFRSQTPKVSARQKLHPRGSQILPPPHMLSPSQTIPSKIMKLYEEVWPLRHCSPASFIGQVRRLLEFVCHDKKAIGKDLFTKLQDLVSKGVFPGYFKEITDLLRIVGNKGAHATDDDLDIWEAELIDDFFRLVIEYVYIAPAKVRRMQERVRKPNQALHSNGDSAAAPSP